MEYLAPRLSLQPRALKMENSPFLCVGLSWSKTNKDSLSSVVITYWASRSYHLTHHSCSERRSHPCRSHWHKGLEQSPKHQYRRVNGAYLNTCYNSIANNLRPNASKGRGLQCPWCQYKDDKFINYFQVSQKVVWMLVVLWNRCLFSSQQIKIKIK